MDDVTDRPWPQERNLFLLGLLWKQRMDYFLPKGGWGGRLASVFSIRV